MDQSEKSESENNLRFLQNIISGKSKPKDQDNPLDLKESSTTRNTVSKQTESKQSDLENTTINESEDNIVTPKYEIIHRGTIKYENYTNQR
jgi:hypothetical protein